MARCPYCGKNIDRVRLAEKQYVIHTVFIRDGRVYYEYEYSERLDNKLIVICPECDVGLPLNYERYVEGFLRGDIVLASAEEAEERGNYAIFDNDVFEIADKSGDILILERVDDDNISKIILKSKYLKNHPEE